MIIFKLAELFRLFFGMNITGSFQKYSCLIYLIVNLIIQFCKNMIYSMKNIFIYFSILSSLVLVQDQIYSQECISKVFRDLEYCYNIYLPQDFIHTKYQASNQFTSKVIVKIINISENPKTHFQLWQLYFVLYENQKHK